MMANQVADDTAKWNPRGQDRDQRAVSPPIPGAKIVPLRAELHDLRATLYRCHVALNVIELGHGGGKQQEVPTDDTALMEDGVSLPRVLEILHEQAITCLKMASELEARLGVHAERMREL